MKLIKILGTISICSNSNTQTIFVTLYPKKYSWPNMQNCYKPTYLYIMHLLIN